MLWNTHWFIKAKKSVPPNLRIRLLIPLSPLSTTSKLQAWWSSAPVPRLLMHESKCKIYMKLKRRKIWYRLQHLAYIPHGIWCNGIAHFWSGGSLIIHLSSWRGIGFGAGDLKKMNWNKWVVIGASLGICLGAIIESHLLSLAMYFQNTGFRAVWHFPSESLLLLQKVASAS